MLPCKEFLHGLFPTTSSVPQVLFYDSACNLKKHIQTLGDHHFDYCIMPVDPFHAKTKHKDSDTYCNQVCNAAQFPDLRIGNKWRFNSSAAEMTNAWFGGFQGIVREMRATWYDFFLDEVIRIRNDIICAELRRDGENPVDIASNDLLFPTHT